MQTLLAPTTKIQSNHLSVENSDSETEIALPAITSTSVKNKATMRKNTLTVSRNMVTGVLNDSTNLGKKKTRPHRPQRLPPNERPTTSRIQFAPQTDTQQLSTLPPCQNGLQHHY